MKKHEIESWASRVIEQVQSGKRSEDTWAELKSTWVDDYYRTARQLAGHANAARGEPIIWIIGVNEKSGVIEGVACEELSNWIASVNKFFDGESPGFQDLNIAVGQKSVTALVFETTRAPYVVTNPDFRKTKTPIALEVTWREGTSTRSATRAELLRILSEKRSLVALLGEMEWNQAVAAQSDREQAQFKDLQFEKALYEGLLSEMGEELRGLVVEAYISISNAQSHKHTLQGTSDQHSRQLMKSYVKNTRQDALKTTSKALIQLRTYLGS